MTGLTRRRALAVGGSVLAGLAGCLGDSDGTEQGTTTAATTTTATSALFVDTASEGTIVPHNAKPLINAY